MYPKTTWENTEETLPLEFESTAQKHLLRAMLEKRRQWRPNESIASYINDAENLCKRINPDMWQIELAHTLMKGLKPEIAIYVRILDNNTLQDLKKNIKKYEYKDFVINRILNTIF